MNVLQVSQEFPSQYYPQLGTFVKQSIDSICKENINVTLISPKPFTLPIKLLPYYKFYEIPKIENTNNYLVHYPRYIYFVPKKLFYSFTGVSYSYFISKYIEKNIKKDYSLIHAHFSYPNGYGMIRTAKKWDVPLVISALGTIERKIAFQKSRTSKMIIDTLNFADAILAVSEDLRSHIINLGIEPDKIHFVPNGVDTICFQPRDRLSTRTELNLPLDKKIVLFIGALREIKGVNYLIESAKDFLDQNTLLIIIGRDDGLKKNLVQRAKKLGILKYIFFIDQVPHESIPTWISSSDLLVLPSLSEGRPNVILEALASGIPVVASNVGGIPEFVINNKNGFLITPSDSTAMTEKVLELIDNEALRLNMGIFARQNIIESDLTWKAHAKKTREIYYHLVN